MVLPVLEASERTFNVNWGGVYFSRGAFLPLLLAAPEGHPPWRMPRVDTPTIHITGGSAGAAWRL